MSAGSVLIVGPSWVGDMVMAQSLFISLVQRSSSIAIDVVAPKWSIGLLERMPEIRNAYTLDVAHGELGWRKRRALAKQVKANNYQRAIVLPRSFKAALVPFFADIPWRTGFSSEMRFWVLNDRRPMPKYLNQTVKRFVALGYEQSPAAAELVCPEPRLQVDANNANKLIERLQLATDRPIVGLMPGAEYGPAKQWPLEYYRELAERLVANGFAVWIFGSAKDAESGDKILAGKQHGVYNLCGKTSLADVIDLIANVSVIVCNDSGLMHIAAAVDKPVIAIYGSSSPTFTPPLNKGAEVQYLNLTCSPCYKRTCPLGHYDCLRNISANKIYETIERKIQSSG